MAGTSEEMLIILESPEKNSNVVIHNHYLKNPLIPGPDLNCNDLESNNPFDVVAQSAENWDPFELVLHQSLMHYGKNDISHVESCDKLVEGEFSSARDNCRLNRSNSVSHSIKFFPTSEKHCDKSETDILNVSSRSLDNSPSLREKIKRVVKKRVSKCIERALNGSFSQADANKHEVSSPKKSQNSVISTTHNSWSRSNKVKKDETEEYDLKHFLEEAKQLSVILHNMSITEETKILPSNDEKVLLFKEPRTLLSEHKVEEEDIMSVKPPWDAIENESSDSDDNSIGLPKVKLFYVKKKEKEMKNDLNQEKLAHYKKRIRASLDGNMSHVEDYTVEDINLKTPHINEQKPEELKLPVQQCDQHKAETTHEEAKDKEPLERLVANKPIVPAMNDLRLRKVGNILKKGPLKAIVPLQKMTKSIADKISPMKTSPSYRIIGKTNEDTTLSSSLIYPVATSTPNNKNLSNHKKSAVTPLGSKSRTRMSRKDTDQTGNTRRSASLCMDARKSSQPKQPFSSLNPNDNYKWKRPHTAPSPNTKQVLKSSPKFKKNDVRKHTNKLSSLDKENRMQT